MSIDTAKQSWSLVKQKRKSPKKEIPNTLKEFFETGHCIYHFKGKCTGGSKCEGKHMEPNSIFKNLQMILRDPTKIHGLKDSRSDITASIKKDSIVSGYKKEPFLTTCWYSITNTVCDNIKHKRFIKYDFKFKDQIIPIYICYPDISTCRSRVTCGFHFDIQFSYINNTFNVTKLISSIDEYHLEESNKKDSIKQESVEKESVKKEVNPTVTVKIIKKEVVVNEKNIELLPTEQKQKTIGKDLYIDLEVSGLNQKTKEELKELIQILLDNNNALFKRNAELSYTNNILSIPVPKASQPRSIGKSVILLDEMPEYIYYSDENLSDEDEYQY